ncbi:CoA transferase [Caenimonas soli]|uniref:CoA transferase n=1 Tax=Caenimonas soli TaxID=2735555 RepID=UPI0015561BBC|nr:CoA transferase [Caenimonas soli]NPC59322.1 hypothetical protein [Caenimonas soli]
MRAPLEGVRVLNLGGIWAGRVAAMLLADQGAEVIEINRPGRPPQKEDALLSRGKQTLTLDLKADAGRRVAWELVCGADIILDNLGPHRAASFGLDPAALCETNPHLVYVSIPGFASSAPEGELRAWEGTVNASVGVYTDLHATGALLGSDPIYTAVPMASAYGGVHAAIAAMVAFLRRLQTGHGQQVEVPLADALMSAMALLAMRIEGQPQRFDLPAIDKAMTEVAFPILRDLSAHLTSEHRTTIGQYLQRFAKPLFSHYRCADDRQVFVNALDHVHHSRACLEELGILNTLIAEGMVLANPYEESGAGNNIANAATMSISWARRVQQLMAQRFAAATADEWSVRLQQAGVPCAKVQTTAEWLEDAAAREAGCVDSVPGPDGPRWQAGRFLSLDGPGVHSPELRRPIDACAAEGWSQRKPLPQPGTRADPNCRLLEGVRVLDLSNVIAGPVSTRTLAEYGADVIRVDSPAPQAGPRMTMWFGLDVNQGKRALILDLKSAKGREVLERLVRQADVVVHNFLDPSLEDIGLTEQQLSRINPNAICCQVTAWAGPRGGPRKDYPAFDPVLQAATGITSRYGRPDAPVMHGVASCVDYISGFTAALGIVQALVARALGQPVRSVQTSLAMGAQLVQFPYVAQGPVATHEVSGQQQKGSAPWHSMYRTRSDWVFLACRQEVLVAVARALDATGAEQDAISKALANQDLDWIRGRLGRLPVNVVPVSSLEALRIESLIAADSESPIDSTGRSTPMVEFDHPAGYRTTLPLPSWSRGGAHPLKRLRPAPMPGAHTASVLGEAGYSGEEVEALFADGVVRNRWAVHQHYLPR